MGNDITVNKNGITYHYTEKVRPESQAVIENTFSNIFDKSWKNLAFFDGLNIEAQGDWGETEEFKDRNYWVQGFTYDPAAGKGKVIHLKTNRSYKNEFFALFHPTIAPERIEEHVLHELGHIFDTYFATPDKDIQNRLTELYLSKETATDEEKEQFKEELDKLEQIYYLQNGLSDSDEFRKAWKKDTEATFKGHSLLRIEIRSTNLDYFSPLYDFSTLDKKSMNGQIELKDGVDDKELDYADLPRAEIFAQLFAYAMGANGDDDRKTLLIETYRNSYEVVKKYINEYLGTNTTGHYVPRTQSSLDYNI